ncbi:hypothetical protein O7626_39735 [Micromonospora sp. WMMD1102]|uniref:hypothetical protein n=1 Tax=Micromonospora sp. WMMD1102 TaxID=3016105 RepID=UPI00241510EA|nr:hypothetical protein [Micromonospora sp. WMMD1102]MDG4791947.1 hypothetical protein [Micromonospora sp. WMMD1102]
MTGPLDLDEIRDLTELHARLAQIVDKGTRGALARDDYVANAHRLAALVPALIAEVERLRPVVEAARRVVYPGGVDEFNGLVAAVSAFNADSSAVPGPEVPW